jgi:hypothetical protein
VHDARMRALAIASLILAAGCGKSPPTDQKGPFLFRFDGKQTVVENVEWGKTEERNGMMGRKTDDGRKIPMVTSGTFRTEAFNVDGKPVTIYVAFDAMLRKIEGSIKLGDRTCELDGKMFSGSRGEVGGVRYRGFHGTCDLEGKQVEFMFGPVRPKDDKDDKDE